MDAKDRLAKKGERHLFAQGWQSARRLAKSRFCSRRPKSYASLRLSAKAHTGEDLNIDRAPSTEA
jgi:hypothetical protein